MMPKLKVIIAEFFFWLTLGGTKKAFVLVDLDDMNYSAESATYSFPCRCGVGGGFSISEEDLEKGRDLVDCRGCSSQIRVSYEIIAE